jgi:metal-responsive CopG/Arc/MetJ family transcriptional regulator
MKTAISLPDLLYVEAEALARRLGVSRSELYARALAELVARHRSEDITRQLDAVYAAGSGELEPDLAALQAASVQPRS